GAPRLTPTTTPEAVSRKATKRAALRRRLRDADRNHNHVIRVCLRVEDTAAPPGPRPHRLGTVIGDVHPTLGKDAAAHGKFPRRARSEDALAGERKHGVPHGLNRQPRQAARPLRAGRTRRARWSRLSCALCALGTLWAWGARWPRKPREPWSPDGAERHLEGQRIDLHRDRHRLGTNDEQPVRAASDPRR